MVRHNPKHTDPSYKTKKCIKKGYDRLVGKKQTKAQVIDEPDYFSEDAPYELENCDPRNPCSSCRINYLKELGVYTEDKLWFVSQIIPITSNCIWDEEKSPSSFVWEYSITYKGIHIKDIKALVDFFTEKDTHSVFWLTHADAGIRELAMNKFKGEILGPV